MKENELGPKLINVTPQLVQNPKEKHIKLPFYVRKLCQHPNKGTKN